MVQAYYQQLLMEREQARQYVSAELQAALRQRTTVASSRDAAIDAIVSALDIYGENVAALACDFFDETMEITGYSGLSAQMPSGIFSREEIERIAHYQATKLTDGNSEGFVEQVSTDAANLVYQTNIRTMLFQAGMGVNGNDVSLPSNDQTAYVAHASPHADYEVRYQRIPQGIETCDFCLMLASRGAVYVSAETAQGHSEYDPSHVHRGCDCIVVAVPCHSEGGQLVADVTFEDYDTDQMYELWGEWKSVTKKYSGKGSGTVEMRERMKQEKLDLMERRLGRREW